MVYKAEQLDPIRRRIALKVIKQALAATQSGGAASVSRASAAASPPNAPAPFQVQLVADEPGVNKTPLMDCTAIRSVNVSKNGSSGQLVIMVELSENGPRPVGVGVGGDAG